MPYTHRKIGNENCVFKKDTGAKVGCTKGSIDKYLAALHANTNESETSINNEKNIINFIKSLERVKILAKNAHTNTTLIETIKQIISMSENEFSNYIKQNPNKNVIMIRRDFNDWIQTEIKESENKLIGGKADKLSLEDMAKKHGVSLKHIKHQFDIGVRIESEHTKDVEMQKEIAMDHLSEDPDYYTKLQKMEKSEISETKTLIKKLLKEQLTETTNEGEDLEIVSASISTMIGNKILERGFTKTKQQRDGDRFINVFVNGLETYITTQVHWESSGIKIFIKLQTNAFSSMTRDEIARINEEYKNFFDKLINQIRLIIAQGIFSHLKDFDKTTPIEIYFDGV